MNWRAMARPPAWMQRRIVAGQYIPNVDGLRFVAIVSVVALHIAIQTHPATWDDSVFAPLRRGVEVFFAISGFILALPFARHHLGGGKPVSLSFYFLRRVTRLEPPYIVIMMLRFLLFVLVEHKPLAQYARYLGASLLYSHSMIYGVPSYINRPAWSLEIEIQFYCLVPLLAYLFAVRKAWLRRGIVLGIIAVMGALQWNYLTPVTRAEYSILYNLQFFLVGFFVADLYLSGWERLRRSWLWELSLPLWVLFFTMRTPWWHAVMPFCLVLFFIAAFVGPLQSRFFSVRWIATIGGMCYSLYLTHALVLSLCDRANTRLHLPPPALWAMSAVAVLAFGTAYFVTVERPCMDPAWPKRLWRKWFPGDATVADAVV